MISILRSLITAPAANLDLIGVFAVILLATPLVPAHHILARDDLAPWVTAVMIVGSLLRGRTLGDGALPSLTRRQWAIGRWLHRVARVTGPLALFSLYEAARTFERPMIYAGIALGVVTAILRGVGSRDGRTAWQPRHGRILGPALFRSTLLTVWSVGAGAIAHFTTGTAANWLPISALVAALFISVGLLEDRLTERAQRRASGRRDGRPYRPTRHRYVLAAFGPGMGLLVLLWLHAGFIGPVDFEQAPVVALHLLAWTGILFPNPTPIAVSCILHEVVPTGGADPGALPGRVYSFEEPPKGALRIDPVAMKRLRVLHHWVVPVRDSRIEVLDDPTRPLWPRQPTPMTRHVLGDAAFEPDVWTGQPQWGEITIRLSDQLDVGAVHALDAQQRRFVILRPFSSLWASIRRLTRTYRWDPSLPSDAVTVLDASTSALRLQDGDILVLSTEGVARAFELEVGAPLYDRDAFGRQRPPQLEDYVAVG